MLVVMPLPLDHDDLPSALRGIERAVERRIRDAIDAGEFRDLPGEGQRLPRDDAPLDERWAATHVLSNAGVLPEWLALRKEIENERDRIVGRVAGHMAWLAGRHAALGTLPAERILDAVRATELADTRFRRELEELVAEVNTRVERHNVLAPRPEFHLPTLAAGRLMELAQGAART